MSISQNSCNAPIIQNVDELLRAITGKDSSGNPVVRLVHVANGNMNGDYFDCTKQGVELPLAALLGLNEEGKVALRVNISNVAY